MYRGFLMYYGDPDNKAWYDNWMDEIEDIDEKLNSDNLANEVQSPISKYLTIGVGVAAAFFLAWSIYSTYQDLKEYYDVEFTPIPHYVVDVKDITAYNANGERIFVKNQREYYKAAECNRTEANEMFGMLGTCADLDGDVGSQWLALAVVSFPVLISRMPSHTVTNIWALLLAQTSLFTRSSICAGVPPIVAWSPI